MLSWMQRRDIQVDEALEATDISVNFQGIRAVDNASLSVKAGAITGVIGPNGAGKTTLVNVVTGFQTPSTGIVRMDGKDISDWSPVKRCRRGISRTFQAVRLFAGLTVLENVEAAAVATGLSRREATIRAKEILEWLDLTRHAEKRADTLTFGDERRVGIGRALAISPRYLLLDEPAAGLNDKECKDLKNMIAQIRDELRLGVLLIEHKISVVFSVSDWITVLDQGSVIAEGTPEDIQKNKIVREAYLGSEAT